MTEKNLKEHWCQEKYEFCRPDGTNEAHQEVAKMLQNEIVLPDEEDWKHSSLPTELEILSVLPEAEQRAVFELAGQQNHCQNLYEWLKYLEQYVAGYVATQGEREGHQGE